MPVVSTSYERDPVSVLWDTAAWTLLEETRKLRGGWRGTLIADPSPRQRAMLLAMGIDPDGPDNPSSIGGRAKRGAGLNARTRWARGFVRAVNYANDRRNGGPGLALEIEVGRHKPAVGVIPAGRAVRLRVRRGGSVALRAVQAMPDAARTWTDDGGHGDRWSDPARRDW